MVDKPVSEAGARKGVEVQVLSLAPHSPESKQTYWGVQLSSDDDGSRKRFACTWIEVMGKDTGIAATTTKRILPYRAS